MRTNITLTETEYLKILGYGVDQILLNGLYNLGGITKEEHHSMLKEVFNKKQKKSVTILFPNIDEESETLASGFYNPINKGRNND